ncbi:DUF475 domain-containing protein [Campylobacter ureolyticus]|uniref:DUF475 domain-containing protein n=1 Tax=Campylobacter ureolyticus TaxID=827 RepID=UPI0022B4986E|nr:DUF475 domain-containing protein [Campylobacter ureolyticus]MCZ6171991.1 DUF475 domain-containing protein [Campylobacter ureolyticus]
MKIFYSSFIVMIFGLLISFFIGNLKAVYICFLLAVLEVSLSFDNAVVNAKILNQMNEVWRKRFIIFGIPIAVFGMRFLFPLLIVSIFSGHSMLQTLNFAINSPELYHEALSQNKDEIYIFGGAFLMMVFFDFFFDNERKTHWLEFIENNKIIEFFKKFANINLILAIFLGLIFMQKTSNLTYGLCFFSAIFIHLLISSLNETFSSGSVRNGIIGFLYLEVLDASFSFDGVIGAFALSENIFIIMIGLGIGAMFVRSITIYLVEKKTLLKFAYLDHGAHYAIFALSIIMFIQVFYEVSEIITGTIGFLFIFLAFLSSVYKNRRDNLQAKAD